MKQLCLKKSLALIGIAIAIALLEAGCGGTWDPDSASVLKAEFESEFGSLPPSGVANIKCRIVNVGDSSSRWLSFECSKTTFENLASQKFDAVERKVFDAPWTASRGSIDLVQPYDRNVNAPPWWPNIRGIQFEQLYYRLKKSESQRGYLFLVLDPTSNKVYAHSSVWR